MIKLGEMLGRAAAPDEVVAALTRWSARRGMPHVAIGHTPSPEAVEPAGFFYTNWPPAWMDIYRAFALVREDPVVARARSDPLPFTWADLGAVLDTWQIGGDGLSLRETARAFGWTNGLVVPVHGFDGAVGIVSFAGTASLAEADERIALQTISIVAYLRLLTLHGQKLRSDTGLLTQRERSVLGCIARGMDDAAIAVALTITERTVRAHIQNARAKLGARTRSHAIAEAMIRGLLSP